MLREQEEGESRRKKVWLSDLGKTEELCNTHPEPDAFFCHFQNSTS